MPLVSITYANLKPALNQNKELETETKNWKHFKNDLTRDKKLSWKAKHKGRGREEREEGAEEKGNCQMRRA